MAGHINPNSVMHFFMGLLSSRASGPMIGVVSILSLIWFGGHFIGLDNTATKLLVMASVLVAVVGYWLVRWYLTKRSGDRLVSELVTHNAGDQAELDDIREKMHDAVASLKASHLGAGYRGNAALYALPWYMIIGPSATGKSTLFANSGLNFPYGSHTDVHIQGFGGTRNCDWWFSDQAVLIDTAGRYATETTDNQEWLAFLALLQKNRPRLPINGVILAFSVAEILTLDHEAMARNVRLVRERIDELIQQLGIIFPVYIVLTKCDLISGFEPFFADLSDVERQQLWGSYLLEEGTNQCQDPAAKFSENMQQLYERLTQQRLGKMALESDIHRKQLIFDFPHQFKAAATRLTEFVDQLCKHNPYQEVPWFVGAYFTSGTQEGTPVERVGGVASGEFDAVSLPQKQEAITQSFFINKLFGEVLFRLQELTRNNRRQRRRQHWVKGVCVVGCLGALLATGIVLVMSFSINQQLLRQGEQKVAMVLDAPSQGLPPEQQLELLATLSSHYQQLLDYEDALPWPLLFGVYQVDQTLPAVERVFYQQLERLIGTPLQRAIELRIQAFQQQWQQTTDIEQQNTLRGDYYAALKLYLMMGGAPAPLDVHFAADQLNKFGLFSLGLSKEEPHHLKDNGGMHIRTQLAVFVDDYLARLQGISQLPDDKHQRRPIRWWTVNPTLVSAARQALATRPDPGTLYQQIISSQLAKQAPLTIESILSEKNHGILEGGLSVPYVYSQQGWVNYIQPEIQRIASLVSAGDWVMGGVQASVDDETARQQALVLNRSIRRLYFNDYARHWFDFLAGVKAKPFTSLTRATTALSLLSSSDGPLAELMHRINQNITLTDAIGSAGQLSGNPSGGNPFTHGVVSQTVDVAPAIRRRIPELEAPFADLRRFTQVAEQGQNSDFLQQYLRTLSAVHSDINRLAGNSEFTTRAMEFAKGLLNGEDSHNGLQASWIIVDSQLRSLQPQTKQALSALFKSPLIAAFDGIMAVARVRIEEEWNNHIYGLYQNGIKGKFPFNRQGPDAAPADVAELLNRRSGILWQFVDEQLSPFLRQRKGKWQERRWNDLGIGLSPALLRGLGRARDVARSLFAKESDQATFEFLVLPVAQRNVKETYLGFSDQGYRYRNEPEEWRRFRWPGDGPTENARLYGITSDGTRLGIERGGPWALLRVFSAAKVKWLRGNEYRLSWTLDNDTSGAQLNSLNVSFNLKSGRHSGLFNRQTMTSFSLPDSLFAQAPVTVAGSPAGLHQPTSR